MAMNDDPTRRRPPRPRPATVRTFPAENQPMLQGFRDFVLRGNVVDLAVAVVIGAAFNGIIDSLVRDILTPLLGLIGGEPDFSALAVGPIRVGMFLNALFAFLIKAAGLYFFVVVPIARLTAAKILPAPPPPPPAPDVVVLREIRDLLAGKPAGEPRPPGVL